MDNKEKMINWLKENQKKPMEISIMVYELNDYRKLKNGFVLKEQSGTYDLVNTDTNDYISLMIWGNKEDEIYFSSDKEETEMEADAQISINEHFTILFYLQ